MLLSIFIFYLKKFKPTCINFPLPSFIAIVKCPGDLLREKWLASKIKNM